MPQRRHTPVESRSLLGWFIALAAVFALVNLWVVFDEVSTRRPYKEIRGDFNARAIARNKLPVPIAIEQITNPELKVVDRCGTCHPAIDRPGFAEKSLPLHMRSHPRRAELLGANHPTAVYGCTVCHHGQGPQTKGVAGRPFAHGLDDHYWEQPLLAGALVESTCVRCHRDEHEIPGAPLFERGRELFAERRCFGCHTTHHHVTKAPAGPNLAWTAQKQSPEFVESWIRDPKKMRPQTRMPDFWPAPVAPDGTAMPPESPAFKSWQKARAGEPRALMALLGSLPAPARPLPPPPLLGDAARGKRLYQELGCRGCHEPEEGRGPAFGPELLRVGEKANAAWLWTWLEDPQALWAEATMPALRLEPQARADLVAHLQSLRAPSQPPAAAAATDWPTNEALIANGKALAHRYGCYGCHSIGGFERAGRAGPELEGFGAKTPELIEWGDSEPPADRNFLPTWTRQKLAQPRRMARDKVPLTMPDHRLTADEVEALAAFVLSDREQSVPAAYQRRLSPEEKTLARGEKLIERHGCRSCHEIGRDNERLFDEDGELLEIRYHPHGGEVRRFYREVALAPPPLTFAGEKLRHAWTFAYLRAPTRLRPWLPGRMPTYDLTPAEANDLVAYFAAANQQDHPFRDNRTPPLAGEALDEALWLFTRMQCLKCHQVSSMADATPAERAPDLALAGQRLTPGWVHQWLLDPQRLQPGTRMPSLFPREDDDIPDSFTTPYPERLGGEVQRQVAALVALTLQFGEDPGLAARLREAFENAQGEP